MHTRALLFGKLPLEASVDLNQTQAEEGVRNCQDVPSALLPKSSPCDITSLSAFKAAF